jgi:hypothetical protein
VPVVMARYAGSPMISIASSSRFSTSSAIADTAVWISSSGAVTRTRDAPRAQASCQRCASRKPQRLRASVDCYARSG